MKDMITTVVDEFDLTEEQLEAPGTYVGSAAKFLRLPTKTARRVRVMRNLRRESEGTLLRPVKMVAALGNKWCQVRRRFGFEQHAGPGAFRARV